MSTFQCVGAQAGTGHLHLHVFSLSAQNIGKYWWIKYDKMHLNLEDVFRNGNEGNFYFHVSLEDMFPCRCHHWKIHLRYPTLGAFCVSSDDFALWHLTDKHWFPTLSCEARRRAGFAATLLGLHRFQSLTKRLSTWKFIHPIWWSQWTGPCWSQFRAFYRIVAVGSKIGDFVTVPTAMLAQFLIATFDHRP